MGLETSSLLATWIPWVTQGLRQAFAQPEKTWILTLTAPLIPRQQQIYLLPREKVQFCWFPSDVSYSSCVTSGATWKIPVYRQSSLLEVQAQAQDILAQATFLSLEEFPLGDSSLKEASPNAEERRFPKAEERPSARFFGALAFSQAEKVDPLWKDFGDGFFFLPKWSYEQKGSLAWLRLCFQPQQMPQAEAFSMVLGELRSIVARMENQEHSPEKERTSCKDAASRRHCSSHLLRQEHLPYPSWNLYIRTILKAITQADVSKVVAARRDRLTFVDSLHPYPMFERLLLQNTSSTCFFFLSGNSVFLGATPEGLVQKQGLTICTEAVAGSISVLPDRESQGKKLIASEKDQREHQWVVQHFLQNLKPLCTSWEMPSSPQIKALPHLLHLHTPMKGILSQGEHILSLVEKLHPTPALGGYPTKQALSILLANEPQSRGLYAGPIGWFDEKGDGHMAVAIRSALLLEKELYLYTGAGIVEDSDPKTEYEETSLKQKVILSTLEL